MQIMLLKKVIFKKCAQFTKCISETKNAQVDDAKDIDVVMSMYINRNLEVYCNTVKIYQL